MTEVCTNQPIDNVDPIQFDELRADLRRELSEPLTFDVEPVHPLNVYTIAFGRRVHDAIRRRVYVLYSPHARVHRHGAERGYVYVFRDRRDRPQTLVKIGSATNVRRRMSQWRRELAATCDDDIQLLFAYQCSHVRMAEAIVHATLFCEWQAKRFNASTNARTCEYFDVEDWRSLEQLVAGTTRHVDWWLSRHHRSRR